jgi:hypothetical protein
LSVPSAGGLAGGSAGFAGSAAGLLPGTGFSGFGSADDFGASAAGGAAGAFSMF